MSKKISSSLLEPSLAIGSYLDDLLQRATENELPAEHLPKQDLDHQLEQQTEQQSILETDAPLTHLVDDFLQTEVNPVKPEPADPVELTDLEHEQAAELSAEVITESSAVVSFPAQCLMFSVGKLNLAIPLIDLKAVHESSDKLTKIPGSDDLIPGLLGYRDQQIRVIDCHRLFNLAPSDPMPDTRQYLILESCDWALACDQVSDIQRVELDDLQRNSEDNDRVIYGNIKQSLTSLLNVKKLQEFVLGQASIPHIDVPE